MFDRKVLTGSRLRQGITAKLMASDALVLAGGSMPATSHHMAMIVVESSVKRTPPAHEERIKTMHKREY